MDHAQGRNRLRSNNLEGRVKSRSPRLGKTKVLFIGEDVSLAHVSRPLQLAGALNSDQYEIHFASSAQRAQLVEAAGYRFHPIPVLSNELFKERLRLGRPVLCEEYLTTAIAADLDLFKRIRPHAVVGDFRLSLAISAPLAGVPYFSLTNAHWSPNTALRMNVPDLPVTRILGRAFCGLVFRAFGAQMLKPHLRAFNRLCLLHGMPPAKTLHEIYTRADRVFFMDLPEVAPISSAAANEEYLGPLVWSPTIPESEWLRRLPTDRPLIYATLGTSGYDRTLKTLAKGLAGLPVAAALATVGAELPQLPENIFSAPYLPGIPLLKRAALAVCNGGSAGAYQALSQGVPLVCVPANADQHYTTAGLSALGVAERIPSEQFTAGRLRAVVLSMLKNETYRQKAGALAHRIAAEDPRPKFATRLAALVRPFPRRGRFTRADAFLAESR
jgi:UDP:flavonoid glycosyltransferase YjiC (YdhE family)